MLGWVEGGGFGWVACVGVDVVVVVVLEAALRAALEDVARGKVIKTEVAFGRWRYCCRSSDAGSNLNAMVPSCPLVDVAA